ncbi:Alpha/Beta hydrolase protein [Lactarius akahatsu]|uniref:Alpha/Beta hydrolase protein n=1 Tax=Lactarius akahatsu TaxID=416441 RepID=A0AAD4LAX2_9AGAM|nr:Alpha/Beta hydrolase protein [Lactarius akahatsu]
MTSEQPFKIAVSDNALDLLKRKHDDTRLLDEVNAVECACGAPLADIKRLVSLSRWKDGYEWCTHERGLNALPMFTRNIAVQGFGEPSVHYVHQRSAAKGTYHPAVLPLLTTVSGDHLSFHVVVPSLPGYAWSDAVLKKGFPGKHYAELFKKLMTSLGYTECVMQGRDWGHVLTLTTASLYRPKHVRASHTNLPMCEPPKLFGNHIVLLKSLIMSFTSREREAAGLTQDFFKSRAGYFAEQSTKPQTLGYKTHTTWPTRLNIQEARHDDGCIFVDRRRNRLMKDGERGAVRYIPKEGSCWNWNTRSADTLRRTSSPKHSWATFGKCSANLGLQQVSFQGVLTISQYTLERQWLLNRGKVKA